MQFARLRPDSRNSGPQALVVLILLLAASLLGQATNPLELLKQHTPIANGRIMYGKDPLEFGEIRIPSGTGPFPVAILIHGGCWSAKLEGLPEAVTSFELLRPIATALTEAGIATWNIEYRRFGNEGGGWPGSYLDIGRAADYIRELAPQYHLDLTRTIAIGHSSGGQLALWLAARKNLPPTSPLHADSPIGLKGVIDIDGPPDLETFRAMEQSGCGAPVVTRFIGGTPAEFRARYQEGAVSGLMPIGVRQELFIRSKPGEQWNGLLESYVVEARKVGDPVNMITLEGIGHFDGINPQGSAWHGVMESVRSLLRIP